MCVVDAAAVLESGLEFSPEPLGIFSVLVEGKWLPNVPWPGELMGPSIEVVLACCHCRKNMTSGSGRKTHLTSWAQRQATSHMSMKQVTKEASVCMATLETEMDYEYMIQECICHSLTIQHSGLLSLVYTKVELWGCS